MFQRISFGLVYAQQPSLCPADLTLRDLVRRKRHRGGDKSKKGNDLEGLHGGSVCWAAVRSRK